MEIMKYSLALIFTLIVGALSTKLNDGTSFYCSRANVTAVRIQNCPREPCTIKKGVRHPVEIDFSFQAPLETNTINFNIFVGYWGVSSVYGSFFAKQDKCSDLGILTCPAKAGKPYTLKSTIYIPLASKDTLNGNKTAVNQRTAWTVNPNLRKNDEHTYSTCVFSVLLNIVN